MSSTQDEQVLQAPASYPRRTPLAELQQAFLDLRLTMFIHYNMATYQDREWGDDKQPISLFNPTNLDTDQWADVAVNAHMQGAFLTTKHHDGFCIWPTKTGTPSVLHTPSQIDVVDAYAKSFRKRGLKVGLYYSILDKRNDIRHFNVTREKIQLVKAHLTELLTNYGDIFMIIFDGWSAPWSRIPYSEVPFQEIYRHVKSLQPDCLVTDLNASDFHPKGLFYGDIKAFEQNAGQVLPADNALPSFSCVTLTDGWFWKLADIDAELKSTYQVVHDWLIPQNERHCTLIVNAPPDREGRLAPNVVERLQEIGRAWQYPGPAASLTGYMAPVTTKNLAEGAVIHSSDQPDGTGPDQANNGDLWSSWYTPTGDKDGSLQIDFHKPTAFNRVLTCEPIGHYSDYPHTRIGRYWWQAYVGEKWITLVDVPYEPGSDHPCVLSHWVKRTIATKVRLWFEVIEDTAHINLIAIYDEPERT